MDINTVCTLLINALKDTGYNDSTIFNYQGAVRRFKAFCKDHDVTEYNHEIGKLYADAVISQKPESSVRSVIIFKAVSSVLLIRISIPVSLIFQSLQGQEYSRRESIIVKFIRITAPI